MVTNRAPTYLSVRIKPELRARLDAVVDRLAERAGGLRVPLATVIGLVIDRGLPTLEAELGITPPQKENPQ